MREEFENWAKRMGYAKEDDVSHMRHAAKEGWNARQPEIDALKEEVALSHGTLESRERNIETLRGENERLRKQLSMLLDDKQHPAHLADMKAWIKSMKEDK